MVQLYPLFEHAVGYSLFKVEEYEEVGAFLPQVEAAAQDPAKFKKVVQLVAFKAFSNAISALENINAISEGILTDELKSFIEMNLPTSKKKSGITLGVGDSKLCSSISEALKVSCTHTGVVPEIMRGIRFHLASFVKGLNSASMKQTELGLGHSYSRAKVKFNVNRVDQMIIQTIALVDQLDKDINTFAMRIREWYSYHFPEMGKIVTDNHQFALCASFVKNRTSLTPESLEGLEEITMDSAKAQAILDAARMSMGMDISPVDLRNIETFAVRVAKLSEYRKQLIGYLRSKMNNVAPNLACLIGDIVGARLISHAGSLTNLAKYPASTVQILGAEKALFRALKTKSNTPKYGLIYHSSFIGRAGTANKGRISRYLANKCSLASRIDCFSETLTDLFGEKLKTQVEDRLKFYESGNIPKKNLLVMEEAMKENEIEVKRILKKEKKLKKSLNGVNGDEEMETNSDMNGAATPTPKKKKKRNIEEIDEDADQVEDAGSSKKKKKKKSLGGSENGDELDDSNWNTTADSTMLGDDEEEVPKKKKKKKKKTADE